MGGGLSIVMASCRHSGSVSDDSGIPQECTDVDDSNLQRLLREHTDVVLLKKNASGRIHVSVTFSFNLQLLARRVFITFLHTFHGQAITACMKQDDKAHTQYLVRAYFPQFISSNAYQNWSMSLLETMSRTDDNDYFTEDFAQALHEKANTIPLISELQTAWSTCPLLSYRLDKDPWFIPFLEVVENLPIAVYITLPQEKDGFIMVYANAFTTDMSQYPRSALIGSKCPFIAPLKSDNTSEKSKIRNSLTHSLPMTKVLQCRTYNGVDFSSRIYCKPLFDTDCAYRYILTVQTSEGCSEHARMIENFISTIPSIICGPKS